jgi:hypothetical protein
VTGAPTYSKEDQVKHAMSRKKTSPALVTPPPMARGWKQMMKKHDKEVTKQMERGRATMAAREMEFSRTVSEKLSALARLAKNGELRGFVIGYTMGRRGEVVGEWDFNTIGLRRNDPGTVAVKNATLLQKAWKIAGKDVDAFVKRRSPSSASSSAISQRSK